MTGNRERRVVKELYGLGRTLVGLMVYRTLFVPEMLRSMHRLETVSLLVRSMALC